MKIAFIQVGKTSEKHVSEGVETYSGRIRKYTAFEIITIPDLRNTRNMPGQEQKSKEGAKILEALGREDYVVLLDERGKEMRTVEFASWLERRFSISSKRVVFISGGAWGFSDEVYARADMKLSLSQMTFPHQLVRLLFAEQLYRAFTVIRREPYHHE